ncbi:MAG: hypothetical protein VKM92_01070 [Cyanobacteriota bacterium]|nr:hypothetical protein [Cyanobacteriota bacterium]
MKRPGPVLGCWLVSALLISGCSEAELPQRTLQADDCLREVRLDQLPQAISRCDKVVAQYPGDPGPRNERSLLLALDGQDDAACREIAAAHALIAKARPGRLDPMLVSELKVRQRSCRQAS